MRKKYQRTPKEKRDEIVLAYLRGENTYQKLGKYYGVPPETIMVWVSRYRKRKNVVSLQTDSKPSEDMARKKKEAEKSADVLALEARIRELELQNLCHQRQFHAQAVQLLFRRHPGHRQGLH